MFLQSNFLFQVYDDSVDDILSFFRITSTYAFPFNTPATKLPKETNHPFTDTFLVKFDSVTFFIWHSARQLSEEYYLDKSKTVLKTTYMLNNNSLVFVKTIVTTIDNNVLLDTTITDFKIDSASNENSALLKYWDGELSIKATAGIINTVNSFASDHNRFEFTYFFKKDTLAVLTAHDESKRFREYTNKIDNKLVSFDFKINNLRPAGKSSDEDDYWMNEYLVTVDHKTMRKVKGKKVRVTGRLSILKGLNAPDRVRIIFPGGGEMISQSLEKDVKLITKPVIRILKSRSSH